MSQHSVKGAGKKFQEKFFFSNLEKAILNVLSSVHIPSINYFYPQGYY